MYNQTESFNSGLHALRGLAAVSVVFFHAALMEPVADIGALTIVNEFGAGVTLFFLLSGFSLTLSNVDKVNEPGWLKGYMIRRIFRIMPLWWLILAITVGYHYFRFGKIYSVGEVMRNLVPVFSFAPGHHESIVWAGWTIGVEIIFYALFPLLIIMLGRSLIGWGIAVVATAIISMSFSVGLPAGTPASFEYMAFPRQLVVFCIGAFLCVLLMRLDTRWLVPVRLLAVAGFLAGAGLWAMIHLRQVAAFPFDPVLYKGLVLGLLVLAVSAKKSFLANPVTNVWGDTSYGVYLLHPILVHETKPVMVWIAGRINQPELAYLAYVAFVLVIVTMLAIAINRLFESPIYATGRTLARKNTLQLSGAT